MLFLDNKYGGSDQLADAIGHNDATPVLVAEEVNLLRRKAITTRCLV